MGKYALWKLENGSNIPNHNILIQYYHLHITCYLPKMVLPKSVVFFLWYFTFYRLSGISIFFLYKAWCPSLSPNIKQYTIANCLALNIHIICHTRDLGFELSYCKCLQNVSFFPLLFPRWHCKTHLIHFVGPTCICCSQKVKWNASWSYR